MRRKIASRGLDCTAALPMAKQKSQSKVFKPSEPKGPKTHANKATTGKRRLIFKKFEFNMRIRKFGENHRLTDKVINANVLNSFTENSNARLTKNNEEPIMIASVLILKSEKKTEF